MRGRRKARGGRRAAQTPMSDDLPSDSPKRKDSKLEFQGRLSHASPRVTESRITHFFHPKPSTEEGPTDESVATDRCVSPISTTTHDCAERSSPRRQLLISPDNVPSDVCTEESVVSNSSVTEDTGTLSSGNELDTDRKSDVPLPITPHKMILVPSSVQASALSPSSALSQLTLANGALKKAPKPRRKLNPSQSSNQLAQVSTGAKLGCFIKSKPSVSNGTQAQVASGPAPDSQHKLTEYFPVRRSERKTKKKVMEEHQRTIEEAVLSCKEEGLEVHNFEGKGRGIVARRSFLKGEFVVEYAGELIKMDEAREREKFYAQDQNTGCYMYYFKYRNNQYCVDATPESDRLGRLVNHSRNGNLMTKTITIDNVPRLVLIAKEDILPGEEVTYDYGDRSKESLRYHPWLAS